MGLIKRLSLKNAIRKQGLGLALSGGALKGFFHIGVLEALEMSGISVKMIAGTSVGALIGGVYAAGLSVGEIRDIALNMDKTKILQLGNPSLSTRGVLKGDKAEHYFEKTLNKKTFAEAEIPFAAVACDIISGKKVVMETGSIARAIRASISQPVIFEPVIQEGMALLDGGIVDILPISVLKERWTGPVLASNLEVEVYQPSDITIKTNTNYVSSFLTKIPIFGGLFDIEQTEEKYVDADFIAIMFRAWSIISYHKLQYDLEHLPPDILVAIDPNVNPGLDDLNKYRIQDIIDQGRNKTLQTLNHMGLID